MRPVAHMPVTVQKALRICALLAAFFVSSVSTVAAQNQSTLRIRVQDETQSALIHAIVSITDPTGVERQVLVNQSGEAVFTGLAMGTYQVKVEAEGFRGYTVNYN